MKIYLWNIYLWNFTHEIFTYEIVDIAGFPSPAFASKPPPKINFAKKNLSESLFAFLAGDGDDEEVDLHLPHPFHLLLSVTHCPHCKT